MEIIAKRTAKVEKIEVSASEWELFTCSFSKTEMNRVAKKLNTRVKRAVNSGMSRAAVESDVYDLMYELSKYGAADTEPRWKLGDILDKIYGE